jgi:hypothetical protein
MKFEFSRQILENSNIKFHYNPSRGSHSFHADRQTDRRDEANSCFSQFSERA